jgi:hypothetical protein
MWCICFLPVRLAPTNSSVISFSERTNAVAPKPKAAANSFFSSFVHTQSGKADSAIEIQLKIITFIKGFNLNSDILQHLKVKHVCFTK